MNSDVFFFAYGALLDPPLHIVNFGRQLAGQPNTLSGFKLFWKSLPNPIVIDISGERYHPIICHTGVPTDLVPGMVFRIKEDELLNIKRYGITGYESYEVILESGIHAWVYARPL